MIKLHVQNYIYGRAILFVCSHCYRRYFVSMECPNSDAILPEGENSTTEEKPLSKRQQKKQKHKAFLQSIKKERRKKTVAKRKKRRADEKIRGVERVGPSRKALKSAKMSTSSCRQRVAVDMSFDDYMSEKDIMKALTQLQYCYSANRRAENPLQFYIVGFKDKSRRLFDSVQGCRNWDVFVKEETYADVFDANEVVYLSSDSENVLQNLDENKVYVIGGLVDHNHHKRLCYTLAVEKNVQHARLPIESFVEMSTRKVLTINHVFEILLRFTVCKDWKQAFYDVIPKRKGATLKDVSGDSDDDEDQSLTQSEQDGAISSSLQN